MSDMDEHFRKHAAEVVELHREQTGALPLPCDLSPDEAKGDGADAAVAAQLKRATLDLLTLAQRPPPERSYAWDPWIAERTVTLLHGSGGSGKSLLLQQLLSAYALNQDLFGGGTMGGGRPTLLLAGEDDHDELWRRQVAICRRLGSDLSELDGKLDLLAVPHLDITLAEGGDTATLTTTPQHDALRERIRDRQYGLIGLDNSAKLFAVPEGNRVAVTRCVGLLSAICQEHNATVVLVAHDNKTGEYSGSTAWENACRSRLHLTRKEGGELELEMPKANYSALGQISLVWDDWSFRASDPVLMTEDERLRAEEAEQEQAEAFLKALDRLTGQGCNVSDGPCTSNYAPKVVLERGLGKGLTKKQLERAMNLLLNEGRIKANQNVVQSSNRHWRKGLARTDAS